MVTRRFQAGFTATEILVVIAIVGILAAVAIPSMSNLLAMQAVRSASYDLNADLTYARSEAISRGVNVSVVGASTTDFKQGWTITAAGVTAPLRTQGARDSKITFTGNAGTYTFDRTGRLTAGSPAQWAILPTDSGAQDHQKRCIKLDPSGRTRTNEGVCS
ncbi:MAG TPA: GspH/FimT family pseudopilin [Usitatibacter sp.]|nr:GspH/FimT family pseudopilin [Usitatibacter sp.]